ncbi:sugar ABC transporter substrate-binding protein [Isoptericola variabilis]|uniref:Extracellular solute-binding protein family 1 n=1 Tax=Isoptericola variabilis (strain 225) TaxID=743718 RepID=F6FX74_ISOV2|nr:sugar ABC transporter substrate-binding protein [Isoptericola variabilis]AEG43577.1 extracellular solute-binding protein family 1 [Isoptericola variabilis 225]TWH32055.1 multiple sugar transport system substrate-binding protein [Isoptericola variabilis J7]
MAIARVAGRRLVASAVAAGLAGAALAACGTSSTEDPGSTEEITAEGVDDGTTLTLWTRAPLEQQANLLVDAYNATHENQVELTVVPNDDYVAKVGAAAGSGGLPDLFAADIVYVPNWVEQGLFQDLTDPIAQLDFADTINEGHLQAGTYEGRQHVLPFVLDVSVLFYNKELYEQAGLDPEQGPTSLREFAEHAKAVDALGGDVSGTFFGGNCGGCLVFTWFPSIWAAGEEVMNEDGTESLLASETAKEVYGIWRDLVESDAVGTGSKEETGATWTGPFLEGNIGVMPFPATMLATADEALGEVGVAPIPGPDGGASTFVGGDGIGISKDSENTAQAWNFLSWLMSEEAQVEVLAKNGDVVSRSDLADNEYSSQDPRVVAVNEVAGQGRTPLARNFQQAFNAPGSPWVTLVRNEVFGPGGTVDADNEEITAVLSQ